MKLTIENEGKVSAFDFLPPEGYGAGEVDAVDWIALLKALSPVIIPILQALLNKLQKDVV